MYLSKEMYLDCWRTSIREMYHPLMFAINLQGLKCCLWWNNQMNGWAWNKDDSIFKSIRIKNFDNTMFQLHTILHILDELKTRLNYFLCSSRCDDDENECKKCCMWCSSWFKNTKWRPWSQWLQNRNEIKCLRCLLASECKIFVNFGGQAQIIFWLHI